MPIQGAPSRFVIRGVSDTLDGSNTVAGACRALTNLIFDPSTPGVVWCRPGAVQLSNFPGFSSPASVSGAVVIGTRVYGLIGSARFSGKDEPFVYDIPTNTFIPLTGVTGAKCPLTQLTTGEWVPPQLTLVGVNLIVTHPGFDGVTYFFGWFDLTNPAAPVWNAGNTTTNALPARPDGVEQFNNRAYFMVGNELWFTDALTLTISNASNVLTVGDSTRVTALGPLPLSTSSQGILQALIAFKENIIFQITGDSTTSSLAINELKSGVGTKAPRSVKPTTHGLAFVANDGLRHILYDASVSDPDEDIRMPFISALYQSRISAAFNAGVYRISVQNTNASGTPFEEYWLDCTRNGWTGPHTFRQELVLAYANTFVAFGNAAAQLGKMYRSDPVQTALSDFTELGTRLTYVVQTATMGDDQSVYANSMLESSVNLSIVAGGDNIVATASDVSGGVLSQATIQPPTGGSLWGSFLWGDALWFGFRYGLSPINLQWTNELVFNKLILQLAGNSAAGFRVGNFNLLYKPLNYILPQG